MATVNVSINLPTLPDNAVWWANFSAWRNYWNDADLTIDVDVATPTDYGVIKQATTEAYTAAVLTNNDAVDVLVDGGTYSVPTLASFQQLKEAFQTLEANFLNLKQAQLDGGAITAA